MCCHIRSASVSRRRRPITRKAPTLPRLAMLDLSKPGELKAHEFLLRATNPKNKMWTLLEVRRQDAALVGGIAFRRQKQVLDQVANTDEGGQKK